MSTCKYMKSIESIAKDINRQYSIQLDYEYIERIRRLFCGSLCGGVCDPKNYVQKNQQMPVIEVALEIQDAHL